MKILLITFAFALPMIAVPNAPCLPAAATCAATPAQDAGEERAESPLDTAMLVLEESLGALRRALRSEATTPDALAALATMQETTLRAKLLEPPLATSVPEPERAALVRTYRRMLIDLLTAQLACEAALLDGDAEAAKHAFQRIRELEDKGHEQFTEGE